MGITIWLTWGQPLLKTSLFALLAHRLEGWSEDELAALGKPNDDGALDKLADGMKARLVENSRGLLRFSWEKSLPQTERQFGAKEQKCGNILTKLWCPPHCSQLTEPCRASMLDRIDPVLPHDGVILTPIEDCFATKLMLLNGPATAVCANHRSTAQISSANIPKPSQIQAHAYRGDSLLGARPGYPALEAVPSRK
ncbi:hypothetical protein BD289DRAFT_454452 [Coniella lustricola]|uniref:Uncharacterized protein n=1 Tax=Coniella lustricola TaxID=2025994 RepID=A0A2T3A3B8_9PEZI|nr:hypothetical protein BD289DRAFT_454452 [Coniella lustricola]